MAMTLARRTFPFTWPLDFSAGRHQLRFAFARRHLGGIDFIKRTVVLNILNESLLQLSRTKSHRPINMPDGFCINPMLVDRPYPISTTVDTVFMWSDPTPAQHLLETSRRRYN